MPVERSNREIATIGDCRSSTEPDRELLADPDDSLSSVPGV
jgi:hypothetical protein